jgi:hypothetical protein
MIRLLASQKFLPALPLAGVTLAQSTTRFFDEAGIGAAILLTLTGMVLHWHLPRHRMSTEERMKDGKMTETEARRQIKFYGWCAPIVTVTGVLVLLAVMFDLIG